MIRAKPAIIIFLTTAGLALSFFAYSGIHARIVSSYWHQQLDATPDDEVEIVIRQIAELDTAGIPILVEFLDAKRECAALAAKQELFVQLERWRTLPVNEYTLHLTALAEALAGQVEHFSPAAQIDAGDLASRILLRLSRSSGAERNKLLAVSEKVLRAGLNARGESGRIKAAEFAQPALLPTYDSIISSELPLAGPAELTEQSAAGLMPLSEDGMAGKPISSAAKSDEDELQSADSLANQPRLLGRQPLSRQQESRIPDSDQTSAKAGQNAARDKQSADSGSVRSMSHDAGKTIDRRLSVSFGGEDNVELIKELNCEDDARAAAIETELLHRGFTRVQLDLARKLFDTDPAVRKRLVQELPDLHDVDTVPWLLQLCRDTDAEVRLGAITLLATSSDPAVLDEVEKIVQRDSDSGIQRIADRITQQRNALR
jgi:hypothetical protein